MTERLADKVGGEFRLAAQEMFYRAYIRVIGENHVCVDLPQNHGPDMHIGCVLDLNRKTAAVFFHELVTSPDDLVITPEDGEITPTQQGLRIRDIGDRTKEKARMALGAWLGLSDFRI